MFPMNQNGMFVELSKPFYYPGICEYDITNIILWLLSRCNFKK